MTNRIAPLSVVSNTLDTVSKWLRVFENAGVTYKDLMAPINDRTLRRRLIMFIEAGYPELPLRSEYLEARELLGIDFISPEELRAGVPLKNFYSADQKEKLRASIPDREELEYLRANCFLLIPRASNSKRIESHGAWIKVQKKPQQDSLNKSLRQQRKLIGPNEYLAGEEETYVAYRHYRELRGIELNTFFARLDFHHKVERFGQRPAFARHIMHPWNCERANKAHDGEAKLHLGIIIARK